MDCSTYVFTLVVLACAFCAVSNTPSKYSGSFLRFTYNCNTVKKETTATSSMTPSSAQAKYTMTAFNFKWKYEKNSRRRSRSSDYVELGHFTFLFCRGRQRDVPRIITYVHSYVLFCLLKLLFRDVAVAVAVVVFLRSLVL